MRYRRIGIIIVLMLAVTLVGCLGGQGGQYTLESDMEEFVKGVYGARSASDIRNGANKIKQYMTPEAFEELEEDLGEYKDTKSSVIDLDVYKINKENAINNVHDKVKVVFRVSNGEQSQLYSIEFVENSEGKFDRYNLYRGIVETSK